jgi:phospholipase/carboxylesterase
MKFSWFPLAVSLCCALFVSGNASAQEVGRADALHTDMGLPYLMHLPPGGGHGAPLIVLLHGMGSNETDLMSLEGAFPNTYAVVSARAPYQLQPGSYEWYQEKVVDGTPDGDITQLAASARRIDNFVGQVVRRYGFDRNHVYLVGFSQGAIMSYEVGLTHPRPYRGLGIMSGEVYDSLKTRLHPSPSLSKMRVFISHGEADPRIPVQFANNSYQALLKLGVRPEFHIYPWMGHEINSAALADLVHWLKSDTPNT